MRLRSERRRRFLPAGRVCYAYAKAAIPDTQKGSASAPAAIAVGPGDAPPAEETPLEGTKVRHHLK